MSAKVPSYTYTVEGSKYGEFPLDMLLRDQSRAASPEDQALIDQLNFLAEGKEQLPKVVRVTLITESHQFPPVIERWESFGWRVVENNHPKGFGQVSEGPDGDAVRVKALDRLAQAVLKLRGRVTLGEVVYTALREGVVVAGQDLRWRLEHVGYLSGVIAVMTVPRVANNMGLLNNRDIDAMIGALQLAITFLSADADQARRLYVDGDALTGAIHAVESVAKMFEGQD